MNADTVGQRIKAIRVSKMMTQEDFAKSINKSFVVIINWEKDKNLPGAEALIDIAQKYDVNINWLLINEGDMYREDKQKKSKSELPEDLKKGIFKYPELMDYIYKYIKVRDSLGENSKAKIRWNIDFE